jgi:hypothetical protein
MAPRVPRRPLARDHRALAERPARRVVDHPVRLLQSRSAGLRRLSTYLGWDDRLGFILENQWFTTPDDTLNQMSVLAVWFRNDDIPDILGIDRVRIDVGAVLLGRTNDEIVGLPWLQVGFGR